MIKEWHVLRRTSRAWLTIALVLLTCCATPESAPEPSAPALSAYPEPDATELSAYPEPTSEAGRATDTLPPLAPQPTPVPPRVTTMGVALDGAVWYAFGNRTSPPSGGEGVERLASGQVTAFTTADGLPHDNVQVLEVAPDGTVWVGAGCAVARFDGDQWQQVGPGCDDALGTVLDIAIAPDGAVWVAGPFDLYRLEGDSWEVLDPMVRSIAFAWDGTLWASGWTGRQDGQYVGRFDGSEWETYNTMELFSEPVGKVAVTPDGDVWGSTSYHGVVSFDGVEWEEHSTEDGLPSNRILDLAVSPSGEVWAVTDRGVARLDGSSWQIVEGAPPWARLLAFGPDGTAWFGTDAGVMGTH